MGDVFRLTRPKPKDEASRALWHKVVARELTTPFIWEVEISKAHTDDEKRLAWNKLVESEQLGLFALVRNVRNILAVGADIETALEQITAERVAASGILPFQWYKAYKAIDDAGHPQVAEAMQQAVEWSLAGMSKLPGVTLVACDNSGSMTSTHGTRAMGNSEIGNLLGAMALYCSESGQAGTFGDTFALADTHPHHGLFYNKQQIDRCSNHTGNSTNAWAIFKMLIQDRVWADRIVLLSDMQCYDSGARYNLGYAGHSLSSELEAYRAAVNPNVMLYSINLATNDNTVQFAPGQRVIELAGFSESIFRFMAAAEVGQDMAKWISDNYRPVN